MQYFRLWSVSSDYVDWAHLSHMKCNTENKGEKNFIAKMYNCGQSEVKIYLFEVAFEMQNVISVIGDLTWPQVTTIWDDGIVWLNEH